MLLVCASGISNAVCIFSLCVVLDPCHKEDVVEMEKIQKSITGGINIRNNFASLEHLSRLGIFSFKSDD